MTSNDIFQLTLYLVVLVACVKPLGQYMARVLDGTATFLAPVERIFYRAAAVDSQAPMTWTAYAGAFLLFNLLWLFNHVLSASLSVILVSKLFPFLDNGSVVGFSLSLFF